MRDYNGVITFDPRLPDVWESLTFKITLRGSRIKVLLSRDAISFVVEAGDRADLSVRGENLTVTTEHPVTVPLTDQGPRIDGVVGLHTGELRRDGTIITATVPKSGSVLR
jgi:alpha,alpha-trehalose phosphorylase